MARYLSRELLREKLDVYISAPEREEIRRRAAAAGLPMSGFVRHAALGVRLHVLPSVNVQQWCELGKLAGNINQIAHALNSGRATGVDPDVVSLLSERLRQLRLALTGGERDRQTQ